jgi:DNA invertase Pin-like site-specific DNA recombinase
VLVVVEHLVVEPAAARVAPDEDLVTDLVQSHAMGKIAIYCRISQDGDGSRVGVRRQEQMGRRYAATEWPGVQVEAYVDNSASGATSDRPEYQRLLEDVRAGSVDEVVVAEQSRLTRDVVEWDRLSVVLAAAGIEKVHTLNGGRVSIGPGGGRLVGRIMAAVNAEERDVTIGRINSALDENARAGRPAGGRVYGYRSVGERGSKSLVIEPAEADAILGMVERLEAGAAIQSVVDWLIDEEVPTARGGRWSTQTVRSVLLKPTVAGLRAHKGEIVGPGNWPAIIPEDRWRALHLKLSGTRFVTGSDGRTHEVRPGRRRARKRLLTGGLSRCGKCRSPLAATTQYRRTGTVAGYGCHPKGGGPDACMGVGIAADLLEPLVEQAVLDVLDTPAAHEALRPPPSDEAEQVAVELAEVEDMLKQLGRMWGAGELDEGAFRSAQSAARERADRLRSQLAAASPDAVDDDPETLAQRWPDLPTEVRRRVIEELIATITVNPANQRGPRFDPDRVDIEWRY